jgi:CRP/FNR family transcriptional regulator, cyclic AMP receptor protein
MWPLSSFFLQSKRVGERNTPGHGEGSAELSPGKVTIVDVRPTRIFNALIVIGLAIGPGGARMKSEFDRKNPGKRSTFETTSERENTAKGTSLLPAKKAKTAFGIKVLSPIKDPYVMELLEKISDGKRILNVAMGDTVFVQGEHADAIFFIESGKVKISVISSGGKEAVLVMLGPRNFLGEGSLVGQSIRISTATALEPSIVFRVEKGAMIRALHDQPALSEKFMAALLKRNIDLEEDLCDQLFNHSEKRLARVLLKLSRLHQHNVVAHTKIADLSHETLAEMVGTTRSRVTHFMNKFRQMGLIDYDNDGFMVRTELLTDLLLHD